MSILRAVAALLPEKEIREIVGTEKEVTDLRSKAMVGIGVLKNLVESYREDRFEQLGVTKEELYEAVTGVRETRAFVDQYVEHYENYPENRSEFENWLSRRNRIDANFYEALDLSPDEQKY